ncbi:unnamed protein product [Eretmochelys imbricata]
MQIYTPHMVRALLDTKGGLWLTQARIAQYQAKLLENSEVTLQPCPSLNPATLLPETEEQKHDCLEIIDVQYSSRLDLKDVPLPNADYEWYTDGSSTVINGQRRAGYAVVKGGMAPFPRREGPLTKGPNPASAAETTSNHSCWQGTTYSTNGKILYHFRTPTPGCPGTSGLLSLPKE